MEIYCKDALTSFENYFIQRADTADKLADSGLLVDSLILGTTALDALAKIWLQDFPETKGQLDCLYSGGMPESIRLSQLLKQFAPGDADASKVAVVCFAEDWKLYRSKDTTIADLLLDKRLSKSKDELYRLYESPKSYLDVTIKELEKECPQIARNPALRRIAEEYEYGSMLYTFYRCPLVHSAKMANRVKGFATEEEIMYRRDYKDSDRNVIRTSISFGPKLITRWLRVVATNYVLHCNDRSVIPGKDFDAGVKPDNKLQYLWQKFH